MAMEYLSKDWMVECEKAVKEAFDKKSRVKTHLVEVYEDCPDGIVRWVELKIEGGFLTDFKNGEGEDFPEATFRLYGSREKYVDVLQGRLDPQTALVTGVFTLEGNFLKALSLIGVYKKIIKARQSLDTEY